MFYVWHNGHRLDNRFVSEEAAKTFAFSHCREGEAAEVRDEAGALCWSFDMKAPEVVILPDEGAPCWSSAAPEVVILPAKDNTEDWR